MNYILQTDRTQSDRTHERTSCVLVQIEAKINILELERVEGAMYHSRCKWETHKDTISKFFFNLEKRQYCNKTMTCIKLDSGELCTDQKRILQEQRNFYEQLHISNPDISFTLVNDTGVKLTAMQKQLLELPIDIDEIYSNLYSMKPNKVPGMNRLSKEFYVHFWPNVKEVMFAMYKHVFENGKFGRSSRMGVISLLPKKGKDIRMIRNLRPLTLSNVDYKIIARMLANHLKKVLPDIIGEYQTGFMENRLIHTNIRKMIDIVSHIYQSGKKAVIVSIDFEKCFERIEHNSIYNAMEFFGFGDKYISWIKAFFNDLNIVMQNAG